MPGPGEPGSLGADVGIGPYGVRSAVVHPTRGCSTGGHKGRPYRPAPGLPVGAGFMPARTGFLPCTGLSHEEAAP